MRIVIAGATGFLGRALVSALARERHDMVVLSRRDSALPGTRTVIWNPDGSASDWARAIDGTDAVINLAGEPIAGTRWTAAVKARIRSSRVDATRSLASAIAGAAQPPRVFVSGSAVGYYGSRGDERLTESSSPGQDFLSDVCVAWEREAVAARSPRTRVVLLRTGLVIGRGGGALQPMLLPFRLGVGGPLGSGRQYWPWIHLDDWVAMVCWALTAPRLDGPLNVTAPEPVTNAAFTRALGRALHRPAVLPAPAFALRLALGEMADALLLSGQRAVPERALQEGFVFGQPELGPALANLVG